MVGFVFKLNEMFGSLHIKPKNTIGLEDLVQKKECNKDAKNIEITNNALQDREIPIYLILLENVFIGLEESCEENSHKYSNSPSILALTL